MKYLFFLIFALFVLLACDEGASDSNGQSVPADNLEVITKEMLLDKIRGGLLGQILGNLNGLKHEMKYIDQPGDVKGYVPALPEGAWTDDDTDFEWVYINLMQQENTLMLSEARLREIWMASINKRIWCSNRYARHLMDLGFYPPYTGKLVFNPWAEFNISGQFICETFGLLAPAMPLTAAEIGLNHTLITIDHEPAQTTQLFTTMIAMAFVEHDIDKLIDYGMGAIDSRSRIYGIIEDVRSWHQTHPDDWRATRRQLKENYTQDAGGMRDMNGYELNTGAVFGALLYGKGDFSQTLELAFNFGWDCDNVAATAGTIIGVIKGYRWMMAQGWHIVDRYKNTTRDQMPVDETITSFADRIYDLAVRNIVLNGGAVLMQGGVPSYEIARQEPANIYPLMDLGAQVEKYAVVFTDSIEGGLLHPANDVENAKAAYLAICLDQWPVYEDKYPDEWARARQNLAGYWKIMQNIYYQSSFASKDLLKSKFIEAGFREPLEQVADSVVWNDTNFWREPE